MQGKRWPSTWCFPVWMCQTEALSVQLERLSLASDTSPSPSSPLLQTVQFLLWVSQIWRASQPYFNLSQRAACAEEPSSVPWAGWCAAINTGVASATSLGGGLSLSFFRSERNHLIFSPDPSSAWIMIKIVVRDVSVWLPFKRRGDAAVTSQNIKSRSGTTEVPPDHSKALPSLSLWRIKLRKDFDLLLYALLFFTDSGVFCSSNCWVLLLGKQGTWLTYSCIVSH